ncbi:hypothetical protein RUM4293_03388 [Ruegeria atlantica]|uniref:Uncharacterized protein n=1 Tax=Ruegeria atlantica TaxID=81569 RepID=A0A0P1E7D9_9RHOB|nr:hypothetical protein RUM4293_03388 [Ruegeria atlantica]
MLRFRRVRNLQKFATVHASVYNHFNQERSLTSRDIFKMTRSSGHVHRAIRLNIRLLLTGFII